MKFNIRLTALLLTLIIVIGLFASCETGSTEETTVAPETTVTPETTAEDTTPAQASTFDLIVNGEAQVKIIRPKDLASTDASVVAAVKIRNEIEDATGVKFSMADDFKKATEEYDDSTVEILVGHTAHAQIGEAISGLSYGDYTIKAVGNKIVVFGFTYDAISYAAKQFAKLVKEYAVETDGKYNVSIPVEALNIVEEHSGSKHLSVLPTFDGATFSGTYESNLDCDEIILEDVTLEGYNAYITKLEGAGFTKYTGSDFSGNLFTTLYNKELTLNVGYYKPYDECRIIMEPFSEETLIGLAADNNRPTVTTSQITMLGCEYQKGDGSFVGNGLSLLFRLSDGSFVIVDGGHSGSADIWANNLVKAIEEQAKDYATGKDIRIAAWFVSHCHGDHNGMLNSKSSAFKKFTVERVIANFMTDSERTKSINAYSNNWSSTEGSGDDATRTAAANMGADFIVCHVGQRFFFGDTVFEILYTVESYGPQLVNALNTSTILVRAITTDASGKSSTTMVMGDVTGPAMAICNKMYGHDMRAQIVQVAHHGYTTWGNDSAMATAYKYMAPEIVLWPQGSNAFPNYKEKSYNKVLWDGTNKNFQQLYVAGWNNTQHIVPLPYSGSPDSITSKITSK
ncbi:MAG: hypothetical protein IIX44_00445 [Clostridia bacterium]|nr:hypothetical protein [Clostridia bacterium]